MGSPPSSIYTGTGLAPPHLRRDWPALVWTRWHEEADIIAALRLSDAQAESARAQLFEAELADALRRTEARRADSVPVQMWPGRVQSRLTPLQPAVSGLQGEYEEQIRAQPAVAHVTGCRPKWEQSKWGCA